MELTLSKNEILPALLAIVGAVDKRQTFSILANILFSVADNKLTLMATDLEIEMLAIVNCVANSVANNVTIPAKKIVDIIKSLDDDIFTLKFDHSTAIIRSGRSQFKLPTLSAENFPQANY